MINKKEGASCITTHLPTVYNLTDHFTFGTPLIFYHIYLGTFIKYYKISQLIHTQSIAN